MLENNPSVFFFNNIKTFSAFSYLKSVLHDNLKEIVSQAVYSRCEQGKAEISWPVHTAGIHCSSELFKCVSANDFHSVFNHVAF